MEITSITASYSKKLNHDLYGGGQYENSDHFVSLSAEVDTNEDILEQTRELQATARELVETDTENQITSFQGGITADIFYTYIRDLTANRPIDGETYLECNWAQKNILQAIKRGKQMGKRDTAKKEVVTTT